MLEFVLMRSIIITGAGSGIGRATALACAKRGDQVVALDINGATAETTAHTCRSLGANALGITCDVRDEVQVRDAFAQSAEKFGPVWGVFANAGIDDGGAIHELPLERWNNTLSINLTGIFLCCKYGLQQMIEAGIRGSVVCSASPCGLVALPVGGMGAYSATKGGISALVRCMAVDYASRGIRVNAIVPGATETGMLWNNVTPPEIERMRAQLNREIPLGRIGQPDDVAKAVIWLLSDESAYVTGSQLVCDGGVLAKASISI
jgi:NAD(P)-dependent dehydrogenase (short-subunit alcohol dehydrogenase family)